FYFCNVLLVLILGMNGMALVYDLFSLYVFLEVTSLAAFILIALYRDARGLEGSFKYLMMSSVASALILVGISLIFLNNGSLQYDAVGEYLADWESASNPILMQLAFIMLISGFSIKAGVAPFHGWLPDAYQSAPAAVSVILGGIVTKMAGVYAIVRLMGDWLVEAPVVGIAFMLLGLFSIILGSLSAVGSHNLKRVLAFSSISQVGYIVLSVSTGSALGLFAAIFHFFNHTIFKTTLYVNSAALEAQCKTIMLERLGGLQKQMPVTAISNILAFLSTAGIPPLAGFWSKLLIIIAVWQTHGGIVAGLALFFSIFTIIYFLLVQRKVFFGASRESLKDVKEARFPIRLASIILSCITVGVGFLFPWLLRFMEANAWI
ncbi:MAG: proton-conducting transporter membrane subunit, partial [Bacillota bacterium]|nr:proton-conducting transporter membrane subunit [Bacillota bacterium]